MELEVIRCCAAAVVHGTIGVNAKLALLPRDDGDAQPPNVAIADSTRHGWVARRTVARGSAATLPAIAISIYRPAQLEGEIMTIERDGRFDVLFEYIIKQSATELALQHGLYTLRALLQTLAEFNKNEYAALRSRNGVQLLECTDIQQSGTWSEREDAVCTAALIATYLVRDTHPVTSS